MQNQSTTPQRPLSPTFDIAISLDSLVAITKVPKKRILRMVEEHDLLHDGAIVSYRQWMKDGTVIIRQSVRISIAEKIFGAAIVGKFLQAGEDY